jgi:hypothetical protein
LSIIALTSSSESLIQIKAKAALDPFSRFSDDICKEILRFSSSSYEIRAVCLVSKKWKVLGRQVTPFIQADEKARIYQTVAFSKLKWNLHFGEGTVEEDDFSSLPQDIGSILSRPCKGFPGNRVIDSHMLVYLPRSINTPNAEGILERLPFTLNNLERLMESKLDNFFPGFRIDWNGIVVLYGNRSLTDRGWVLMMKDVIPGSRGSSYSDQVEMVENIALRSGLPYQVPSLLEAAACIYMWYVNSEERLFSRDHEPWTYTSCEEVFFGCSVIVGSFSPTGLNIVAPSCSHEYIGVAPLLR